MDCELGCKARGLATDALFSQGLPGSHTVDTLMHNIDEQLADTNKQIEDCVRSILDMSNSYGGNYEQFYNPADAIEHLSDKRVLEKTACLHPESDDITKLLRTVLSRLDKHPGCEEMMLQQLFELSSRDGISLPVRSSATDTIGFSSMSLNMAVDHGESINESLWSEISARIRKYYVQKLSTLPTCTQPGIDLLTSKRLTYVQSLCSLYSPADIWHNYMNIRCQQFAALTLTYGQSSNDVIPFIRGVNHFEGLVMKAQCMMNEDYQLVNSGVFGSAVTTMNAVRDIYLDRLYDEISAVVDGLHTDLSNIQHRTARKTKDEFTKSSSESTRMTSLRGSLRKHNSKSFDSLLSPSREDVFTDLQWLPTNSIGMQVRLVNCIMGLDAYLTSAQNMMTWQVTAPTGKKPTQKRLKSALKCRREPLFMKAVAGRAAMLDYEQDGDGPQSTTRAMMAELTSSLKVVQKESIDSALWDWRSAFSKVAADMCKCIQQHVKSVSEKAHELDSTSLDKHKCYEMVPISESLVGGRLDYPSTVSKGVIELSRELDILLPLAKAFNEGPLQIVRAAFVDNSSQGFKSMALRFNKVKSEVLDTYSLSVWYQCLANESFIRNQLYYYDVILTSPDDNGGRKCYSGLYRQFCEMTEETSDLITQYHKKTLCSSILHDSDSHDWAHSKEFYEDERCSFALQMWNLHMKSLRADLWHYCPSKLAQSIYLNVLKHALLLLAQRYSKVKASYRRTKQIKFDITAILMCTSELLLAGCDHVGSLLDPSTNEKALFSIHNSCCTLVAVMAVICSPIDVLYRVFKKGFGRKSRRGREEDSIRHMYMSQWITCVRPDLIPFGVTTLDDLQTTTALYIQLQIVYAQPEINYSLLLQSLLMKDYTLSILLLTQVSQHCDVTTRDDVTARDQADNEADVNEQTTEIFSDFVTVLLLLENYPAALSKVLLPVCERSNCWQLFDNRCMIGQDVASPPWIDSLLDSMQAFFVRLIEPGLRVVIDRSEDKAYVEPLAACLEELPCGCSPTHSHREVAKRKETRLRLQSDEYSEAETKEVLAEAIYSMVVQLNEDIYTLCTPLIMLFRALQEKLTTMRVHAPHGCVAIKLIATGLRRLLLDLDTIETLVAMELSHDNKQTITLLAECIYHVITSESYGKSSGIPRIASLFMKANRNWLSEQIEIMADHCSNDVFDQPEVQPLVGNTPEYTNHLLTTACSHIINAPQGTKPLLNIYHLLENNLDWTLVQLDIPPLLGKKRSPTAAQFTVDVTPKHKHTFNPLTEYATIATARFDMAEIRDVEFDWSALLQSDLGVSEVGFKSLLFNRHEMQEGAQLDESERRPVDALKKRFEADASDFP